MIKRLPFDFSMEKYGLKVRLATEADTEYILSLRADKELTKFIHQTDNDAQKHLEWFKNYRIREAEGRDYYFIYFKEAIPSFQILHFGSHKVVINVRLSNLLSTCLFVKFPNMFVSFANVKHGEIETYLLKYYIVKEKVRCH